MLRTKFSSYMNSSNLNLIRQCINCNYSQNSNSESGGEPVKGESQRLSEFRKKLRETTPIDDLGDQSMMNPSQKDDPLPPFPDNTNPITGEIGGPRGPEPTRYGDWERKGRVTDF